MTAIVLTNGGEARVDPDICDAVGHLKWRRTKDGYVAHDFVSGGKTERVYLHRLVLGDFPGHMVDHISGDRKDCRRANLRHVTAAGNARNRARDRDGRSGFKGVSFNGEVLKP